MCSPLFSFSAHVSGDGTLWCWGSSSTFGEKRQIYRKSMFGLHNLNSVQWTGCKIWPHWWRLCVCKHLPTYFSSLGHSIFLCRCVTWLLVVVFLLYRRFYCFIAILCNGGSQMFNLKLSSLKAWIYNHEDFVKSSHKWDMTDSSRCINRSAS